MAGHRLADRRGLKERLGVHRSAGHDVSSAVPLRPVYLEVADDGDAHPRHAEALHHLFQGKDIQPLAAGNLDTFDAGDVVGRGILSGDGRDARQGAEHT